MTKNTLSKELNIPHRNLMSREELEKAIAVRHSASVRISSLEMTSKYLENV